MMLLSRMSPSVVTAPHSNLSLDLVSLDFKQLSRDSFEKIALYLLGLIGLGNNLNPHVPCPV